MDLLGKMIWKAACNKAGNTAFSVHPLTLISETICQGEKTVKRRLNDERLWLYYELLAIEKEFKDEVVSDYIIASHKNAFNS